MLIKYLGNLDTCFDLLLISHDSIFLEVIDAKGCQFTQSVGQAKINPDGALIRSLTSVMRPSATSKNFERRSSLDLSHGQGISHHVYFFGQANDFVFVFLVAGCQLRNTCCKGRSLRFLFRVDAFALVPRIFVSRC